MLEKRNLILTLLTYCNLSCSYSVATHTAVPKAVLRCRCGAGHARFYTDRLWFVLSVAARCCLSPETSSSHGASLARTVAASIVSAARDTGIP